MSAPVRGPLSGEPAAACIVAAESMTRRIPGAVVYTAIGLFSGLAAIFLSFTSLGIQLDNDVADWLSRLHPLRTPARQAAVLAFDERTLMEYGGIRDLRRTLAMALERLAEAQPAVVAVDITLAERGDPAADAALERVFARLPHLVLACEMTPDGKLWQDPPPGLLTPAALLGHVNALPGPYDAVNRRIALERVAGRVRRFAMSLQALRLATGARVIDASPTDIVIGSTVIDSRWDEGRPLRIHYRDPSLIPHISVRDLLRDPAAARRLAGRVVFTGVTAQSASDRLFTPLSTEVPLAGVEIHAQAFETMFAGEFLEDAPLLWPVLLALAGAAAICLIFGLGSGRWAYAGGAAVVLQLHLAPWLAFRENIVLSAAAPVAAGWLAFLASFSYRFFIVRRRLETSEQTSQRYQQAFRFVAHELRTPLTAIQGSGELLTRYNLPEEKRRQLATMIQSESRRLAGMISTFLDVEKLSAGQMELRREEIPLDQLISTVAERARPLAERKQIALRAEPCAAGLTLSGDRELLEYALYNLVTNAIKYSPPQKEVEVAAARRRDTVTLTVRDQGIGMDEDDLKRLFTRFFRSERAVATGETGTGIGLAIVDQIVSQHGGRIEVLSRPGQGSAFTVILPGNG
jgi:signal transduction histidine kinase